MKLVIKLYLLLFLPFHSLAQNTLFDKPVKTQLDSICYVLLHTKNDTLKMCAYRDLHFYYSELNRDTALYFAEQQLKLARQLNQKIWQASALESIGYVTQIEGNYPKSHIALTDALKIAEDEASEKNIWSVSKFSKDGDGHKVRFYNLTAIHILFSFLYLGTGNQQKAFDSFEKAIKTSETIDDKVGLIAAYANYGNTCLQFNKLDSAIVFTSKAIQYLNSSDLAITNPPFYNFEKGNSLNTMGQIYIKRGNYELAKRYLAEAAPLCQDENSMDALVKIYITLANLYTKTGQLDSSLFFAYKSLDKAKILGSATAINNSYNALSETFQLQHNFEDAFTYLKFAKTLNDSLNNSRQEKVNQYQNLNFDEQLRLVEVEKEKIKLQINTRTYTMLAGIGIFILISVILYRNNLSRTKANQQLGRLNADLGNKNALLDKRNAENELLLKEIHHRVKNNLEIVTSLLELQSSQIDDPAIHAAMLSSQNRVHSMGIIHQKLYQGEHLASIEMRDYFVNLGENILDSFNADGRIKVSCSMPELVLDVDTAISVGLIANELLTNALKYAFTGKETGEITIGLTAVHVANTNIEKLSIPSDLLMLKIADNGIGKQENGKVKGTGFGTQLVSLLTQQLDGTLTYENNNGTIVSLIFKKRKIA